MSKTILLTGATDGIGLETAKSLVQAGHTLLVHGRSEEKLARTVDMLVSMPNAQGRVQSLRADMSDLADVDRMAEIVIGDHGPIHVLINNAGVYKTPHTVTETGLDVRFVVNTLAPYALTQRLWSRIPEDGRVINLSSAAQAPVNLNALAGQTTLGDMEAYAQSKLAILMWSVALAEQHPGGPVVLAVNPGSLLASKMVKEGFGVSGHDLSIGSDCLMRAALDGSFAAASGRYFDNDAGTFGVLHPHAADPHRRAALIDRMEAIIADLGSNRAESESI